MKNIFTFMFALVVVVQSQKAISQTKSTTSNIDELIETKLKETGIVGLGAAIIVDKKLRGKSDG